MNLRKMIKKYQDDGLNRIMASARVSQDIDLDFIHYPISDEAIKDFVRRLDVLPELKIELTGDIKELAHQDYHGKRIHIKITDSDGYHITGCSQNHC